MGGLSIEPKVSIVILNYNRPQHTVNCVRSVFESDYSNFEVIVVDNCSEFPSYIFLRERMEKYLVTLIRTESNLGYAGGNNFGMLRSTGKYILVLNDDVIVDSTMISGLVNIAEKSDTIGIIGPATYRYGSSELWFYSPEILRVSNEILDVPLVIGAALMIKRQTVQRIGLLDENYFMYHEEWDWCVRARDAGYRVVCAPKIRAWHNVREDTYFAPYFAYFYHRNYFLFAAKNCKTSQESVRFLFRQLIWSKNEGFSILYPFNALKKNKLKAFKAYFWGIISGVVFFLRLRFSVRDLTHKN